MNDPNGYIVITVDGKESLVDRLARLEKKVAELDRQLKIAYPETEVIELAGYCSDCTRSTTGGCPKHPYLWVTP